MRDERFGNRKIRIGEVEGVGKVRYREGRGGEVGQCRKTKGGKVFISYVTSSIDLFSFSIR